MHYTLKTALLAGASSMFLLSACGEEIDVSFGSLAGDYSYERDGVTCSGRISGSKISAECVGLFTDEDSGYHYEGTTTATLIATLRSDQITAEIVFGTDFVDWESGSWGYCSGGLETVKIKATATKHTDRSVDGRFSAIAGGWDVGVEIDEQKKSGSASDNVTTFGACKAAVSGPHPISSEKLSRYNAAIEFLGNVATGDYTWIDTTSIYYGEEGSAPEVSTNRFDPDWNSSERFSVTASEGALIIGDLAITKR